ncbi:MAG: STY0301 family protein [Lysobacter sp.]
MFGIAVYAGRIWKGICGCGKRKKFSSLQLGSRRRVAGPFTIQTGNFMSSNQSPSRLLLAALLACPIVPAAAAEVCAQRPEHPLRLIDVFDGTPQEMATLVPDGARKSSGYWELGYIYEAGRVVTIRCKYADGKESDVTLSKKVQRCRYKIDAKQTLSLDCS